MAELRDRADEFLEKPIQPDGLPGTVAALVARGRAARPAGPQAVLAIGAHPGDAEIGAAGALLAHRGAGSRHLDPDPDPRPRPVAAMRAASPSWPPSPSAPRCTWATCPTAGARRTSRSPG